MFSQTSSLQEGFNYPDQTKDLAYSSRPVFGRIKRKSKQNELDDSVVRVQKDKLFFKIGVIRIVGNFVDKCKSAIVLEKHNLKNNQLFYLESETKINQKQNLIPYASKWILLVQILVCMFLCINLWKNSYQIVFSKMFSQPVVQGVTLFIYGLHILLFHRTEFKNQKMELISNREVIYQFYMNQRLLSDVIVIVTLILQITPLNNIQGLFTIIRLLSFFMVKPLLQIAKKLQNIISVSTQTEIIMSIAGLFAKICLILHTLTLIFTVFSKAEKTFNINYTWLESNNLQITSDLQQYIVGWYWGATILSTVGFGDITPANHYQRGFISIIQVSCSICFGFFVNYIGSLITRMGQSKKNYQKDVRMVNRYLLKQTLPDHLKSNIRCHYLNKYKIQEVYDPKTEDEILQTVPCHLKNQIIQTRNISILKKSKLNEFSQDIIKKLSLCLKKIVFAPQQMIYSEKSKDTKLWIIQQGLVQEIPTSFNSKSDKVIALYDKDDQKTLGWLNFLTGKIYKTTARAKTFTLGYELKHQDFIKILRQREVDYNKMHQLKQSYIQSKRKFLNKCLSCKQYNHNVIACPKLHYIHRSIYQIKMNEKKLKLNQKTSQKRKPHADRSQCRFSWKTHKKFTNYNQQIESMVSKFVFKNQIDQDPSRRYSVQSLANIMLKSRSMNQKHPDKRSSEKRSTETFDKDKKLNLTQIAIELQDMPIQNIIDKVYLGQDRNYLENGDFNKIVKRIMFSKITDTCNKKQKG